MKNTVPASVEAMCPECKEETLHRTLKGRFAGKKKLEMVLKCAECGRVHDETFKFVGQTAVRTIISRGDVSERISMEISSDWLITVGDEFMHKDERLLVTGIEVGGKRVNSSVAGEIQTLWTKNYDTIDLDVSVNFRGRTKALKITVAPEDEFEVGADMEIDSRPVFIHSIKTENKRMREGTATANEIVRIYCTEKGRQRRKS